MKNPNELRQEAAALESKARKIVEGAEAAESVISEDDSAKVQGYLDEAEKLRSEAKAIEDRQALVARAKKTADNDKKPAAKPPVSTPTGSDLNIELGDKVIDKDPNHGFESFTEYAWAVRNASHPSHKVVDERLIIESAAQGAATYGGDDGGFQIPDGFSNDMLARPTIGLPPILSMVNRYTLTGNSVQVTAEVDDDRSSTTKRHSNVIVYWTKQAGQITKSGPLKTRKVRLELNKVAALSYATEEELSDVANYSDRLLVKFGEAINEEITYVVNFGTGVGQPLGCFNDNNPSKIEVAKETSQKADSFTYKNLIAMYARMHPGKLSRAMWMHSPDVFPQLAAMSLAVGQGGSAVYVPPNGAAGAPYGTLLGRPVFPTDHCPVVGDAKDVIFADYSDYLLATKGTPTTAMSVHIRFDYDETAFKMTFRVDGRPAWDAAQTPRNGGDTLSPWVYLAERA